MKTIKRIWNTVTTILAVLMVVLAAMLWGSRLLGYEALIVQSGSMEPSYPVGSLVYIKPVDPLMLKTGDVITFEMDGGMLGTHRLVGISSEDGVLAFHTKGDANGAEDANPVLTEDIVGQVKFVVPRLGYLVTYIQTPPGIYIAVCAVALLLLLTILPDIIFPEEKQQEVAQ